MKKLIDVDYPLLLDGAMGTMLQAGYDAAAVHRLYLEAGADLITTNTFGEDMLENEIREAVRLARQEVERMNALTPERPRFVLGDVGPTGKMLSLSDNMHDSAARSTSFDSLYDGFRRYIACLMSEGVDGILMETIFDTLNVKAAIAAYESVCEERGEHLPLLLSMTISDASGRTLSGQTVEAWLTSVLHARPYSVGINCGLGAEAMLPYLRRMRTYEPSLRISCHPNAGLPNAMGQYDETPDVTAGFVRQMLSEGLVQIVGGCCGTTPAHIAAIRKVLDETRRSQPCIAIAEATHHSLRIAGLEAFDFAPNTFVTIGEQCNVAGSRKFLRLISEHQYDEALAIARTQIERGADVLDINMDDGLLNAEAEMVQFVRLIGADPSIARVPLMIDSSRFEVIEAGLKNCQGKCIVNSLSLKQGEAEFLREARIVHQLGAAVVVMCFDEQGQATDYDRRIAIAQRAYRLLTEEVGFAPTDIIFDPNVLTIATGMEEHRRYALDFIRATEWITTHLPGVRVSGGISNLSFAFRGNNTVRRAMHSVFLHLAGKVGMNMAITNAATAVQYDTIHPHLRDLLEAVILDTSDTATEQLTELARQIMENEQAAKAAAATAGTQPQKPATERATLSTEERVQKALLQGRTELLIPELDALLAEGKQPIDIISGPMMAGMNEVGTLFGEGKMFLPQVVRTARTMKTAVDHLTPYMTTATVDVPSRGKILIATVRGDVHDIGKNIVSVVLGCNGFEVVDLGVMVPPERIVEEAVRQEVDIVCLSGLITPSLTEMATVATQMQEAGLSIPLMVGGATTSALHTAVSLAPLYRGGVFHMSDASRNPVVAMQLLDPNQREAVLVQNLAQQRRLRLAMKQREQRLEALRMVANAVPEVSQHTLFDCDWTSYTPTQPPFLGQRVLDAIPVNELIPLIDWLYFYHAWRVKEQSEEGQLLRQDAEALLSELAADTRYAVRAEAAFFPARQHVNSIYVDVPGGAVEIPTPRQERISISGQHREQCLALSDFVSPLGGDYVGAFAATMSESFVSELEELHRLNTDIYRELLLQTLGDRLAEAAAEYMSRRWAAEGWGGIRPAVGYPCLPEQNTIFDLARMIDYHAIGITLTENGAMYPQSSVSGLYLSHPNASYFTL